MTSRTTLVVSSICLRHRLMAAEATVRRVVGWSTQLILPGDGAVLHLVTVLPTPGPNGWQEIDGECSDEDGKEESNNPFEDGSSVVHPLPLSDAESNSKANENKDPGKLNPERGSKNPVLALVNTKTLVLGAYEDGGEQVADNEDRQESLMHPWMPQCVEDGKQYQASSAYNRGYASERSQNLLTLGSRRCQATSVAEPLFADEDQVERDYCDTTAGDEERFQQLRANVRYVGNRLVGVH